MIRPACYLALAFTSALCGVSCAMGLRSASGGVLLLLLIGACWGARSSWFWCWQLTAPLDVKS